MERREFIQSCGVGLCSCAVASLFASAASAATERPTPSTTPPPTPPPEDRRIRFAQDRYAKLLDALAVRLDPATLSAAIEEVGSFCAGSSTMVTTFAGKPDDFLATIREKWHADARYDAASDTVALAFAPMKECPCGLVKAGVTPATMCQCSIGWQRRAFETVFQRQATVALKGSMLRGNDRCSFEIKLGSRKQA